MGLFEGLHGRVKGCVFHIASWAYQNDIMSNVHNLLRLGRQTWRFEDSYVLPQSDPGTAFFADAGSKVCNTYKTKACTQPERNYVPNTTMAFGTLYHHVWVLGPSGPASESD